MACGDGGVEPSSVPATAGSSTVPPSSTATVVVDRGDVADDFALAEITVAGEDWLVAVARTPPQRAQGLMSVTDLGDLDGMLFVFEGTSGGGFWMKDTLLPLEVAFFSAGGILVDVLAMVPCEEDPCPVYTPSGSYRFALEALPGPLAALPEGALLLAPGLG